MNELQARAEGVLVAACVNLVFCGRDENRKIWMECIRDALTCLEDCSPPLYAIRASAHTYITSVPGRPRECAWTRLHLEVVKYFQKAAGTRYEALQTAMKVSRRRVG